MSIKEKLIELVRSEQFLYDVTHEDYANKTLKDAIWERIAQILNLKTGSEARTMWLKLRNCHRDALRRKIRKTDPATSVNKPWIYERQMQFLLGHMNMSSGNVIVETHESGLYEDPDVSVYGSLGLLEDGEVMAEEPDIKHHFEDTNEHASIRLQIKNETKTSQHHDRQVKTHSDVGEDALFHFFMFIYNTVKPMPLSSRLRVKRKIFEILAEEEDLLHNTNGAID